MLRPIAYRAEEAALVLGVSPEYFRERIGPHVRRFRDGRTVLYPAIELERWASESAALPLDRERA
jgi:predicted nucleotidyltransferase